MRKLLKSMKTLLLVAAGLCVGASSAWADGNKRVLNSQNYESATATDWTCTNGNAVLKTGDTNYGKYAQCYPSGSGNRTISKTVSFSSEPTGSTTAEMTALGYNIEFDFLLVGGNVVSRSESQFTVTTSGNPIFSLSQPTLAAEGANEGKSAGSTGTAVTTWYVNDLTNTTTETITLDGSTWYHLKLVVTATSATYTITNNSTSDEVKNGSKTIDAITKITGFGGQVGRGSGKLNFDNLEIYDYTEDIKVSSPTFTFKKVDGAKRVYTLANPDGSGTLYYTTSPADEAPAKGDAAYTSTTNTSLDVEYNKSGTYYAYVLHSGGSATSEIVSQAVTAGELTLAAPVFKIEDMVQAADGYFYPKVSFTSTNSLEGNPVPTYNIESPYTFNGIGYIDVTASAEGYTSSTSRYTVSKRYKKSKTIDFGALTANDFDANVWTSATGVPRDYWTNRAAGIPADVTYYKLTDSSADCSGVLDGITITNGAQRQPEVYIGYGLLTPYAAISGSGNYMNFTVNAATAEDFIVYDGWNNYGSGTFNTVQTGDKSFSLYRYDTMLRNINVYSPATEVELAIADCKTYETSADFATYIDGGTYASAAEVYAAHTAWQVAQAKANGSTDYSKVILNHAVTSTDRYWGNLSDGSSAPYDGAPDNYYLTWNEGEEYSVWNGVYGLPAGKYTASTYTYSSIAGDRNQYIAVMDPWGDINTEAAGGSRDISNAAGWVKTNSTFVISSTTDLAFGVYNPAVSGRIAGFDNWTLELTALAATITDAGWATLYTPYALDFSSLSENVTAYTATIDGSTVTLKAVQNVPANTGVVLKGTADTYFIPVIEGSSTNRGSMQGSATEAKEVTTDAPIYILKLNANSEAQFMRATKGSLAAGKAYLPAGNGGAKALTVVFANDPTGIATVNAAETVQPVKRIVNGQLVIEKNGKRYNAAGAEF